MFASLHDAACRITGVTAASSISESDSSESDVSTERKQQQHQQQQRLGENKQLQRRQQQMDVDQQISQPNSENQTTASKSERRPRKPPTAMSSDDATSRISATSCASREQCSTVDQSSMVRDTLCSVPRTQLDGIFTRTSKSVQQLRDMLKQHLKIKKELEDHNQLLKSHIDQLGALLATTAKSEAETRKIHNQSIKEAEDVKEKVIQVSGVATNYAMTVAKSVIQSLASSQGVSGLDKSRESRWKERSTAAFNESMLYSCRLPTQSQQSVSVDSQNRNLEVAGIGENRDEDEFESPRSSKSNDPVASPNAADDTPKRQAPSEYSEGPSSQVTPTVDPVASSKELHRPPNDRTTEQPSKVRNESLGNGNVKIMMNKRGPSEGSSDLERLPVAACPVNTAVPDVNSDNGHSPQEGKVATILDVTVVLDNPPSSGSRSRFRVLATDSIVDVVTHFSQQNKLPPRKRLALIEYLEGVEEEAERFPAKVEVQLKDLQSKSKAPTPS